MEWNEGVRAETAVKERCAKQWIAPVRTGMAVKDGVGLDGVG